MAYIALIHADAEPGYGVTFPDFPGCVTVGDTLEEARLMAEEALGLHIRGMTEDGEALPEPSSLDTVMADPENKEAAAVLIVSAPMQPPKTVRVNITLPEQVLEGIDRHAAAHGYTRSGFLAKIAREAIGNTA